MGNHKVVSVTQPMKVSMTKATDYKQSVGVFLKNTFRTHNSLHEQV